LSNSEKVGQLKKTEVTAEVRVQCTVDQSEASPAFSGAPGNSAAVSVSAQPSRARQSTHSPALTDTANMNSIFLNKKCNGNACFTVTSIRTFNYSLTAVRNRLWVVAPSKLADPQQQPMAWVDTDSSESGVPHNLARPGSPWSSSRAVPVMV